MSLTLDDLQPLVESQLADHPEISRDFVRATLEAVWAAIGTSADASRSEIDLILEDSSGQVVLLELKSGEGKTERLVSELARDEAPAAILTGSTASALARAMAEWMRQQGSYREVLDALAPRERGPLSAAALLQARRNAEARQELLEEFPAWTSAEVAEAARSKATNRASLANRWRDERRAFAVRVGDQQLYPAFQFDEQGRPYEVIAAVLEELRRGQLNDWQTALWFTSPNGWIGARRPVDEFRTAPEAVIRAAEREVGELVA